LSVGYKEKVMTAEAIQKAALKSQKRKQLADEKREKDKVICCLHGKDAM
jgi:INO80 complex subunit B